ncbi:hypothetical protein [Oleiharenicola lentus]|uniref:hypothetical protein n=1 Tax=Oleiharenicola lentus TaxID=2508720 RepID=UPI003F6820D6
MTSAQLVPAIVIPLVAWRMYRRFKKNVGRQELKSRRLLASVVIFGVITALLTYGGMTHPSVLIGLAIGLGLGVPLALYSLRLTKFEITTEGKFYTPNTVIGVGLTLIFVGRIAYRMMQLFAAPPVQALAQPQFFQGGLTMGIFGLTAGYYIAYYGGVFLHGKKL